MTKQVRDAGYLADIQTAIAKVNRYTNGMDLDAFIANELVQDAVLRNIAIIGEAVSKLSKELTEKHDDVHWLHISGMRNRLVHEYNGVNLKLVWNTIQTVIPSFSARITQIQQAQNLTS
ncbi:MAG: DUF86 domain-containing protein [Azonexus sp.]|jgi:uncharacterized protein with HEPN domain|nr:DUF86 domain-containing protein [Azonexus sp.]